MLLDIPKQISVAAGETHQVGSFTTGTTVGKNCEIFFFQFGKDSPVVYFIFPIFGGNFREKCSQIQISLRYRDKFESIKVTSQQKHKKGQVLEEYLSPPLIHIWVDLKEVRNIGRW